MSLYDNMFGEDSEKHAVRNGIVTFVLLYAIVKGFENGTLTWKRILIAVIALVLLTPVINGLFPLN